MRNILPELIRRWERQQALAPVPRHPIASDASKYEALMTQAQPDCSDLDDYRLLRRGDIHHGKLLVEQGPVRMALEFNENAVRFLHLEEAPARIHVHEEYLGRNGGPSWRRVFSCDLGS